jgi:rhomboid protease GluP
LVTSVFLHIGVIHLVWNCYWLLSIDSWVEKILGTARFLIAYLLCGVAASAASVLCHNVLSAGASGAGFGMIGLLLAVWYRRFGGWRLFLSNREIQQWLAIIGVWLAMGIGGLLPMDNFAHLGGLAFGVLLGSLYRLQDLPESHGHPRGMAAAGLIWLGLVLAACYPWPGLSNPWRGDRAVAAGFAALSRGDSAEAIRLMNQAEAMGIFHWQLYANRGVARSNAGDNEGALRDLDLAVQLAPAVAEAYYNRACVRARVGHRNEARADYRKALQLAKSDWPPRAEVQKYLEFVGDGNGP